VTHCKSSTFLKASSHSAHSALARQNADNNAKHNAARLALDEMAGTLTILGSTKARNRRGAQSRSVGGANLTSEEIRILEDLKTGFRS
jgi:hypothetical protein